MTSGTAAAPPPDQLESGEAAAEAPPKQVALALERLTRAARLIADVRLGADHLLESLFAAFDDPNHRNKTVQLLIKESSLMRQHFEDLRAIGRQLEDSGVLNGSLKQRGNSWGLHMPLVCPDGAVVAYAWKRQLAGQAGASSVDRTRLALKAFSDQKRRFFPHLEEKQSEGEFGAAKRHCSSRGLAMGHIDELREGKTLFDILNILDRDVPNVKISTYQRLEWLKKASSLSCPENENLIEPSKEPSSLNPNKLKTVSADFTITDETAVIELLVPSVLRVIVSLHPAGSTNPDAVAFFSPDEGGNYIHARGFSVYHVFRHTTEYADKALQYFLSVDNDMALPLLLHWICNYQTLFTKACSKCGRLLAMDKSLGLLLPPVHRPYSQVLATKSSLIHPIPSAKGRSSETSTAYHLGCSVDET